MAGYILLTIWKHRAFQVTDKHYEHISEMVMNINSATIM